MRKYNVWVTYNEVIEAENEFEAEQIALEQIGRDYLYSEEVEEPEDENA